MTRPRQILPGRTYALARRCTQRQFLLTPTPVTNWNVEYCLALAAERTGVLLHAVCVMSNHWHGVVTDPEARLPQFLETFHKLVAKSQNAVLGRWENFWSSEKTSVIPLESDRDVIDKMAYALANPTVAGLVNSPDEWPGVISRIFGERQIAMPDVYFDEGGNLPAIVNLAFVRPPIFADKSDEEIQVLLFDAVANLVARARANLSRQDRRFVGREAVLTQRFTDTPKTEAPRRNTSPRIAARSTALRVAAIKRMQEFVSHYREAWRAWREGNRAAVFPFGTYALRVHAGVTCADGLPA